MKILLTGGAGFIGSHVVDRLLVLGEEVVVLDNFEPWYDPKLKEANGAFHHANPRYRLIRGDICDDCVYRQLRQEIAGGTCFDAVVHLAARVGVQESIDQPSKYYRVNVDGTQRLLEFAREQPIPQFVFASTSDVYGVKARLPWSEDEAKLRPISPYAITKMSGESLGHLYSYLYGIRFVGLRIASVYGPRQRPDQPLGKSIKSILDGRPVSVFGRGETLVDYTFVTDIVDGIVAALNYHASSWEIINLGSGRSTSLSELLGCLQAQLGRRAELIYLHQRMGDVPEAGACIKKAARLLGYYPKFSLASGLERVIESLMEAKA